MRGIFRSDYSSTEIACTGQVPTHAWHKMQVEASHTAVPSSPKVNDPVGQTAVHAPQPMQASLITIFIFVSSSLNLYSNLNIIMPLFQQINLQFLKIMV